MDEREAEEKRDAEIRRGIVPVKTCGVSTCFELGDDEVEVSFDGATLTIKLPDASLFLEPDLWERLSYAVERTLEEAR